MLLLIASVMFILIVIYSFLLGITPTPSSAIIRDEILKLVPKSCSGLILELGSGWGNLAFPLASHCPQSTVLGYELSPVPWLWTRLRFIFTPLKNLKLLRKNFFKASFKDSSILVCYLYPGAMLKLRKKFEEELQPGTIVISHCFAIPTWEALKVVCVQDLYHSKIYVYQTPNVF